MRRRTEAVDRAVQSLFAPFSGSGLALAAVGGYGRRELAPGSDVDLLFLCGSSSQGQVGEAVDAVLYPLWDARVAVSHAVRTPAECVAESRKSLPTLAALLDLRMVSGNADLFETARGDVLRIATKDLARLVAGLLAEQDDRDRRFGTVWMTSEPDLKVSVGGLRDVQLLRWLRAVGSSVAVPPGLGGALDLLLRARVALHLVSGATNRLAVEHQASVATRLGYRDEEGWSGADALMRDIATAGRIVHSATSGLRSGSAGSGAAASVEGLLAGAITHPEHLIHPWTSDAVAAHPALREAWLRVQGRPQRDPYHRYPVDVHLLDTVRRLALALRSPGEPFAAEAVRAVGDPFPLLLGGLLHDIGKVGAGSHVQAGARIAGEVLSRLRPDGEGREEVLFLVREHLLLADTATRRNLEDEDLILHVAARVVDRRRLSMLYLLTVADAVATGPSAASPWRMSLIRDLVSKVDHVLERGQMDSDRAARLDAATLAVRNALSRSGAPMERVAAFIDAVPAEYLLWVDPAEAAGHADLVTPLPLPGEVRTGFRPGRAAGTHRVAVGAIDRPGLLAAVAGSFTLCGLTILSARAFTTADGVALDIFDIRGAFEEEVDASRWVRFRSTLGEAFAGADLRERVRSLRTHYGEPRARVPVAVRVDKESSDFYTVVEVEASDRLGLLFEVAATFADHGIDVHVAKVSTYGPRVVDVFYVRDEENRKPEDDGRIERLVEDLRIVASGR